MGIKGGNNVAHFPALRGCVRLTVNAMSDIRSVPFVLIEKVMQVHPSGICAANSPHGIYSPAKKGSSRSALP